ncbi:MAG: hypothetical protein N0A16_03555 [Blastocatellia bacterium]|nr:hypothetical protein [Blastocatellia bacterium]MCS7156788.1 hypothetical protein [Blastocatellia bacterium]MCX7752746.1 hypothetical protein [Blastocatellia bacterium]MDW8167479.1 hypothetical protein [Acidobacteriota bacterium]MDW8256826.1 hypothetical protein [Acidobacteriota bacterium]
MSKRSSISPLSRRRIAWVTGCFALLLLSAASSPDRLSALRQTTRPSALNVVEEVLAEVSRLRGLSVRHPVKAGIQSRAEIERHLVEDLNERISPEEFDAAAKVLIAFGLAPRGFDYRDLLLRILTEQVAGYYRPKTKTLYLADWLTFEEQRLVMVHELVHALQDQHFNLARFEDGPKGESDRDLAVHALIEGEAMGVMLTYILKPQGLDLTSIPVPLTAIFEQLQAMDDDRSRVLQSAPAAVRESLLFPYTYGTAFVQYLVRRESWTRVSRAYADPPDSTEQILHPEKFFSRDRPIRIRLNEIRSLLGRSVRKRMADRNGEFGYRLILQEYVDKRTAERAAEGWEGDQFALYEDARTGHLILVHLSTWESEAEAREFADAYGRRTMRRYKMAREIPYGLEASGRAWETDQGRVYIERRGADVLVVEGLPNQLADRWPRLRRILWTSRKLAPREEGIRERALAMPPRVIPISEQRETR